MLLKKMTQQPTESEIRRILQKHFPNAVIGDISRINHGYTHYMYDCKILENKNTKNVILRIGYTDAEEYTISKELWVMKQYKNVGAPIPKVFVHNTTRLEFEFEYLIMKKISGNTLGDVWASLTRTEQLKIAFKLGKLLVKDALLAGYGIDKASPEFDELVKVYRLTRDIGFIRFTAKSGAVDAANKALLSILSIISC